MNDQIEDALVDALNNLRHCFMRASGFNETSLNNFASRNSEAARLVTSFIGIESPTAQAWINAISDAVFEYNQPDLMRLAREAFSEAVRKGHTLPSGITERWCCDKTLTNKMTDGIVSTMKSVLNFLTPSKQTRSSLQTPSRPHFESTNPNSTARRLFASDDDEEPEMFHDTRLMSSEEEQKLKRLNVRAPQLRIDPLRKTSQNAKRWFELFERQTLRWSDDDRCAYIVTLLDEEAGRAFDELEFEKKFVYKEIKSHIIERLSPDDLEFHIKGEFYRAKQLTHESVDTFANRILEYAKDWPDKNTKQLESDTLKVFRNGLVPEIRSHIITFASNSFSELRRKARQIEASLAERKTTIESSVFAIERDRRRTWRYGDDRGRDINNNISRRSPKNYRRSISPKKHSHGNASTKDDTTIRCNLCFKTGHDEVSCYAKRRKEQKSGDSAKNHLN